MKKPINIKKLMKEYRTAEERAKGARKARDILREVVARPEEVAFNELKKSYDLLFADVIREAEGRATARTITGSRIIEKMVEIDTRLNIPDVKKDGIKGHFTGAEKFPTAYKYTPESTHFYFEYRKNGVYVTEICRDICPNRTRDVDLIELPAEAKAALIDNIINNL